MVLALLYVPKTASLKLERLLIVGESGFLTSLHRISRQYTENPQNTRANSTHISDQYREAAS